MPYIKSNPMWIIDLNITAQIVKLFEDNINVNLCDVGLSNAFLEMKSNAQVIKKTVDKSYFLTITISLLQRKP